MSRWIAVVTAAFMTLSGQAGGVVLPGKGTSPSSSPAAGPVSRGGTITATGGDTIMVDGIVYGYSSRSAVIHAAPPLKLRAGTQIRFNTVKDPAGGSERIIEIWLVGYDKPTQAR